jgi:hypothetical protein
VAAKDFKKYNVIFKEHRGKAIEYIAKLGFQLPWHMRWQDIDCWPAVDMKLPFVRAYSHDTVAYAVYQAEGFLEWQRFRVSMKTLSTRERIFALCWYWEQKRYQNNVAQVRIEAVRINNYVGSLIRAGMIQSGTLKVLK